MAGFASSGRLDVSCRLSLRQRVIVTCRAWARHRSVVIAYAGPARRDVTGIAIRRGRHVPHRLGWRDASVVAIAAACGQSTEVSVRMAVLAGQRLVGAVKRKTGRQVIKPDNHPVLLGESRSAESAGRHEQNCHDREDLRVQPGRDQIGDAAVGHQSFPEIRHSAHASQLQTAIPSDRDKYNARTEI